ncbi:MAG TPA: hypothetical protein VNM45_10110 [Bacillus sp. (in: firmicutes)]|nr:hypothetical protein [Bacillus sp. (in: firmicutes)]
MKKKKTFLFLLVLLLLVLVAYESSTMLDTNRWGIEKITVRDTESGKVQTFKESKDLKVFSGVINDSSKISGVLNVGVTDYIIRLHFNGDKSKIFYLWLEKEGQGMMMEVSDTNVSHKLSKADTDKLRDILDHS